MAAVLPNSSATAASPGNDKSDAAKDADSKLLTEVKSRGDFSQIVQGVLERFYLQPFPDEGVPVPKTNLKDGIIERETHGAMHAVRVSNQCANIT